jgi:hypothetical protein
MHYGRQSPSDSAVSLGMGSSRGPARVNLAVPNDGAERPLSRSRLRTGLPTFGGPLRDTRAMPSSSGRCWPARRKVMGHSEYDPGFKNRRAWNSGWKLGAKRALKAQQVWAIRFWLDREQRVRDRAIFDSRSTASCAAVTSSSQGRRFFVAEPRFAPELLSSSARPGGPRSSKSLSPPVASIQAWLEGRGGTLDDFAFPSRVDCTAHMSTRQYARLVDEWVTGTGLRREDYVTHSLPPNQGLDHPQADRQLAGRADLARTHED